MPNKSALVSRDKYYILRASSSRLSAERQFEEVYSQIHELSRVSDSSVIFVRLFLSDVANQIGYVKSLLPEYALSIVGQAPLDGTKVSALVYMMEGVSVKRINSNTVEVLEGDVRHYWTTNVHFEEETSREQTRAIFDEYIQVLDSCGMSLLDNCIRTWFFVHDIDRQYSGVVTGRNEKFAEQGLSTQTHFIASTGIGGESVGLSSLVQMDAYSVRGVSVEDIHYLYAKTHLNPTAEYGVSFERGTYVDYPDGRRVFISGTASIDNKGNVLYEGDIIKQTERMMENVQVLLSEAGAGFSDVRYIIVYLRDIADYSVVRQLFVSRFGEALPFVFLQAPVCRPKWLIEMECVATV